MYYWKNISIRWENKLGGICLDLNFIKSDGMFVYVINLVIFFFGGGNISMEGII